MMTWIKQLFCKHDYIMYGYSADVEYYKCNKCNKHKDLWVYKKGTVNVYKKYKII